MCTMGGLMIEEGDDQAGSGWGGESKQNVHRNTFNYIRVFMTLSL
jgi:hypothetical protein